MIATEGNFEVKGGKAKDRLRYSENSIILIMRVNDECNKFEIENPKSEIKKYIFALL
jgi:hypothetical protein